MKRKIKKILIIASASLIAIIGVLISCGQKKTGLQVESVKTEIGTLSNSVTATGTVEAIKTVTVGTQVSGTIKTLYVDFNSHVKKGQLLAKIDETILLAQSNQTSAQVASAKAELVYQQANFGRVKSLYDKDLTSKADFDQAQYSLSKAEASHKSAVSEHERSLTNLSYASIYSPIDGVVLNRAVDEGQTVAASFNTPELFSIANDLTQMQVQADVDEADIGQVKLDQQVSFTVDAYPDDNFSGLVAEIRLKPTIASNVVTYTVIIKAPNPGQKLMPGMTANITIVTEKADKVVFLPTKALKFWPADSLLAPGTLASRDSDTGSFRTLWQYDGQAFNPIKVVTGINDGTNIEIISGLKAGEEVVADVTQSKSSSSSSSPFMPKPPSGKKNTENPKQ
jgi:HlyD family secretion protein